MIKTREEDSIDLIKILNLLVTALSEILEEAKAVMRSEDLIAQTTLISRLLNMNNGLK